jgi:hypothetical protein
MQSLWKQDGTVPPCFTRMALAILFLDAHLKLSQYTAE